MIHAFENLTPEESKIMINAPALVTILIAAADNNIDKKEKEWAIKLAKFRSFSSHPLLLEYYTEVNKEFEKTLNGLIESLPEEHFQRNKQISTDLEKLNNIFPKLHNKFAIKFYESLLGFAKQVAESSGGILRFSTISEAEKKWIDLKMVQDPNQ